MKRLLIVVILIVSNIASYAQNDTTVVKGSTEFIKEYYISKSGEQKPKYYCNYNGEKYTSNKTSYDRSKVYKRFNQSYVAIIITNTDKKSKRIIIL